MPPAPDSVSELDDLASTPDPATSETLARFPGDVMVAGAGGKMGFHLCRMLRRALNTNESDARVIAVSRFGDSSTRASFEEAEIETIAADLTDPAQVEALPDVGAMFFLAGMKFGTSEAPEMLRLFNETMPSLVADRFAGVPTVALSTGCVYPYVTPASGGSRESDPVGPVGEYARSCLGRELAFREASRRHHTPLALVRLNYSVDLRYGVLVDVARKVFTGEPVRVDTGYFNCIWQGDALRHIIRSLSHAKAEPDPFVINVTGERILSVRETALDLAGRFGKSVSFIGTETETAWLSDARESHRLFGPPQVEENELIGWVADWIRHDRPLLGKPTHFETRDGKF